MENNYETLRMPELKALARDRRLRNYFQLRKAELIAFLQNTEHQARSAGEAQAQRQQRPPQRHAVPTPQMSPSRAPLRGATWEPQREPQTEARQPELEAPLTKRQLNNKKRSHTQLDSRKQVIAFQDRVITINIKEAQHPLK